MFSESSGRNAEDEDAAPGVPFGKNLFRIVIGASSGDDRDFMSAADQVHREVCQVLSAGDHIGIKCLIEKQNPHLTEAIL